MLQKIGLLGLASLFLNTSQGQVALQNTPYTQNFDGIGAGLPVGWTVRTGSSMSDLGTAASFTSANTSWATSSGNFRNAASGIGLTSDANTSTQSAATNRALALRQTGAFGDNGAAFLLQLENTSGKANFSLSFSLQSLDAASPRTANWLLQVAKGASPASFTTVSTLPASITTGGISFATQTVTANLSNLIDDEATPVWIRIVTLSATTGSGNRPTTAVDDFSLSWTSTNAPAINLSKIDLEFPPTVPGNKSAPLNYQVSGNNLSEPIQLTAFGNFEISKDGVDYRNSLQYALSEIANNPTVSVRFAPLSEGMSMGTVIHNSPGAMSKTLNLSGSGRAAGSSLFDFNTCIALGAPGSGFTAVSVSGDELWQCTAAGRNGTNGVQVNGFANGTAQLNEDWLISPALDLAATNLPLLQFYSSVSFSGPTLEVFVSNNYSGSGNPNAATWTKLNANFPQTGTSGFISSGDVLLQDYKVGNVYIGFKYTSSAATNAARWTLDDISIRDADNFIIVSPAILDFGEISTTEVSAGKPLTFQSLGNGPISWQLALPFELSKDSVTYTNQLNYTPEEAALENRFFVRVRPSFKALQIRDSVRFVSGVSSVAKVAVIVSSLPASETFDVVTLNTEFLGNTISAAGPANKILQRANIVAVINRLQPDVLAIQEVTSDVVMASLMDDLGGVYDYILSDRWSYSFNPPDPTFPPQKIGFIYKKANVSVLSSRVLFREVYDAARTGAPSPVSGYPTGTNSSFFASGRLPFMVEFSATNSTVTKQFKAVVLHGKSGGSNIIDWQRRQYDNKALYDTLQAYHQNDPVLILGDFNDRLAGSINPGQTSSYGIFLNDPVSFRPVTLPSDQAGLTSFLGSGNNMIDHIMVSNEWFAEYIDSSAQPVDARNFINNYASTTSDHLPVMARFDLKVSSVLPVQLLSLRGISKKAGNQLDWLTTRESALSHFEIERSENGISFTRLDRVAAVGAGSGVYTFMDPHPIAGLHYYRLKMVDQDGRYKISPVVKIANAVVESSEMTLYPNPVRGNGVQIRLADVDPSSRFQWQILNAEGNQVASGNGLLFTINQSVSAVSQKLPAGMYVLKLRGSSQQYATRMVILR